MQLKIYSLIAYLIIFAPMNNIDKIETNLKAHVKHLSEDIGTRTYQETEKLNRAADYIEEKFRSYRCNVKRQSFKAENKTYYNIEAEVKGTSSGDGIIIVGAHYDTAWGTPGADDNASGVAGLLELSRLTSEKPLPPMGRRLTVRFVAFALEEPPFFRTRNMGSYVYAESLKNEGANVKGMVALEMLGYFCDKKGCQYYPLPFFRWFYPDKGNFLAFVGNIRSRQFTLKMKKAFQKSSSLPVESLNTISLVPGVDLSDHLSFWRFGYPAFMITDTAFYRNPHYHGYGDRADTLDYKRMAEFVRGFYKAVEMVMGEK
ncbi:MAG: M28 family peptidase [Thermodesulfovibrionales bacterium]|nr:M28 family peptidase [Thermodesulfovibrionales bacterium]